MPLDKEAGEGAVEEEGPKADVGVDRSVIEAAEDIIIEDVVAMVEEEVADVVVSNSHIIVSTTEEETTDSSNALAASMGVTEAQGDSSCHRAWKTHGNT